MRSRRPWPASRKFLSLARGRAAATRPTCWTGYRRTPTISAARRPDEVSGSLPGSGPAETLRASLRARALASSAFLPAAAVPQLARASPGADQTSNVGWRTDSAVSIARVAIRAGGGAEDRMTRPTEHSSATRGAPDASVPSWSADRRIQRRIWGIDRSMVAARRTSSGRARWRSRSRRFDPSSGARAAAAIEVTSRSRRGRATQAACQPPRTAAGPEPQGATRGTSGRREPRRCPGPGDPRGQLRATVAGRG